MLARWTYAVRKKSLWRDADIITIYFDYCKLWFQGYKYSFFKANLFEASLFTEVVIYCLRNLFLWSTGKTLHCASHWSSEFSILTDHPPHLDSCSLIMVSERVSNALKNFHIVRLLMENWATKHLDGFVSGLGIFYTHWTDSSSCGRAYRTLRSKQKYIYSLKSSFCILTFTLAQFTSKP